MSKGRLEAFSDGVIAILITTMVLELHVPHGADWQALAPMLPTFLAYVLSFVFIAIYWNNHHHVMQAAQKVDGRVLWANQLLLFFLSLVPFTTAWMGANHREALPTALYGADLFAAGASYGLLQWSIIRAEGEGSRLRKAVGSAAKEWASTVGYALAIGLAWWRTWAADAIYVAIALVWLVPDRRIARALAEGET